MSAEAMPAAAPLPAFSGVFVFGDSLTDPGNDLRAARALDALPFVDLPNGAPTPEKGYFEGRFTDGYNFADLISNKIAHEATRATFPYGFEDPLLGLSAPFVNRPTGLNLSFAYGGAQAIQSDEPVPDLDGQTDAYRNYTADPGALYIVAIGGNDVRDLVPRSGTPLMGADAEARLSAVAGRITNEVAQLYERGARHLLVVGIPDVGLTPDYLGTENEAGRRSLLTQYAERADALLKADLASLAPPAGATLYNFDFLALTDAVVANPAAYGFTDVTHARTSVQAGALEAVGGGFLFFDKIHPSAQAHAQIAAGILEFIQAPGAPTDWSVPPSIGAQAAGAIPVSGADAFETSLAAGRTYVVDLLGASSGAGSLGDPRLRVLDASGATVAEDDDGGLGLDSHLQFVAPSTGAFTVQVLGVGVTGGSYRLQAGESGGPNLLLSGQLRGSDVAVLGGVENDTIAVVAGSNYLRGGDGADMISGGAGFDDINGNAGADRAFGGPGGDWVVGGKDDDELYGDGAPWDYDAEGSDIVLGNLGDDTLNGGGEADQMRGGQGDDLIYGEAGADWLSGDRGSDTLTGGGGGDIFHSFGAAGLDRVTDFSLAEGDRVQLDPGSTYSVAQSGPDTVISVAGGAQLVLAGVTLSTLGDSWMIAG